MIATKNEIKSLAYGNNFDINSIKDNEIEAIELTSLLPLVGKEIYDDIVANPTNYASIIGDVKTFIAYSVKYAHADDNHYKDGNKGTQVANGTYENAANPEKTKRNASFQINVFRNKILKWLKEQGKSPCKKNDFINKQFFI